MNVNGSTRDVTVLLERLGRLSRGLQHAYGLRPAQWESLRFLASANQASRSPGGLAAYLGSTRGTVSQTLIALEKKGLIARKSNRHDGRGTDLELTGKGRSLVADDPLLHLDEAVGALTPEGRRALASHLTVVLRALEVQGGFRGFGSCKSCGHFKKANGAAQSCARTGETVAEEEDALICGYHEPGEPATAPK